MISAVDYGYKPQPSLFVCSETRHPHLAPGALGGHTVSNKGYSPDCHINLHAVFYLEKKRGCVGGGGGEHGHPRILPPSCSFTLTMPLSEKSEKILGKGGTGEGGRLWWIIVTSKPDREYLYLLSAMENGKGTEVMWVHLLTGWAFILPFSSFLSPPPPPNCERWITPFHE